VLGVAGAAVLAMGRGSDPGHAVSLAGDLSSLGGAVAMVGYLGVGARLRGAAMPLFVYAMPVTGVGAAALSAASMAVESTRLLGAGEGGVFGWLGSHYWWKVLYLATGPGLLGHTGFNLLLTWLTPLTISLALTLEPVLGSFIGWAAGLSAAPGLASLCGGAMLLAAVVTVTVSTHRRELAAAQPSGGDALP